MEKDDLTKIFDKVASLTETEKANINRFIEKS